MQEDGLDIFQIIEDLFNNKYKIIVSTIFFSILGYAYNTQKIEKIEIVLPISEISKTQESKLSSINFLDLENSSSSYYKLTQEGNDEATPLPLYSIDTIRTYKPFVTSEKLIQEFYKEFYNFDVLRLVLEDNNQNINEDDLVAEINKFKFVNKDEGNKSKYNFILYTNSIDKNKDISILMEIVSKLNSQVKLNIIDEVNNIKTSISYSIKVKFDLLNQKIETYLSNYKRDLKQKVKEFTYLIFLRNNYNIDVEEKIQNILQDPNLMYFSDALFTMYSSKQNLLNYEIDQMISDLSFENDLIDTTELTNLRSALESFSGYSFIDVIENALLNSGLYSESFNVIQFDYSTIQINTKKGILDNTYFFASIGFFLSSLSVLVFLGYKRNRESVLRNK